VGEPRPVAAHAGLDDPRVLLDDQRVHERARPDAVPVEDVGGAPDADAGAVVAPAVVEGVGQEVGGAGPDARRRLPDEEVLDVQAHVDGDLLPAGPGERGTVDDRAVGVGHGVSRHERTVEANIGVRFKAFPDSKAGEGTA
jgi:hypothetical protein